MINNLLKESFPFVSKYFETLLNNAPSKFPQSIVFEGLDIVGQYFFTIELARLINCEKEKKQDCNCISCRWSRESKHPAVVMVTPVDFKDDTSKTVISVAQAKKITQTIKESSDYHRFFIFLNAKNDARNEKENALLKKYDNTGIALPNENWTPIPLTMKMFKNEASNSLLKSIEEPPENTTFVFLTSSREDLISTIVSRSNIFKLSSRKKETSENTCIEAFKCYPKISLSEALNISTMYQEIIKSGSTSAKDVIDELQNYVSKLLKANLDNIDFKNTALKHINVLEKAKKRLNASMSPKVTLDSMFMDLSNSLD